MSADDCLDDGWLSITRLLPEEKVQTYKANAFLASSSRIDDRRMMGKYQSNASGKYTVKSYSISERERMMGLPVGYVSDAVNHIFKELEQKAFLQPETNQDKTYREY